MNFTEAIEWIAEDPKNRAGRVLWNDNGQIRLGIMNSIEMSVLDGWNTYILITDDVLAKDWLKVLPWED